MSELNSNIGLASRIHGAIQAMCHDDDQGTDGVRALLMLAGLTVETAFLFDEPVEAMDTTFAKLEEMLGARPVGGTLKDDVLPPATIIDFDAEQGRQLAREFFEEYLDCPYEFHDTLLFMLQQRFVAWEDLGQRRAESSEIVRDHVEIDDQARGDRLRIRQIVGDLGIHGIPSFGGQAGVSAPVEFLIR